MTQRRQANQHASLPGRAGTHTELAYDTKTAIEPGAFVIDHLHLQLSERTQDSELGHDSS